MQRSAKPADLKASPFIPFRYQQTLIKTLVDRINKNSCHLEHQSHLEPVNQTEAKKLASERSPERKRENPESPSPDRKHENPQSPPPDRKNENHPFIIQKSSSTGATSAVLLVYLWYFLFRADSNFLVMTPNIFDLYMPKLSNYAKIPVFNFLMFVIKHLPCDLKNQCHLEPDSLAEAKELASERSPERKCENEHSPSKKRKSPLPFFIPGTRIKFVINRKKHFYCYLENTTNGNRIVGLSAGTKRDIAEILNRVGNSPPDPARPPSSVQGAAPLASPAPPDSNVSPDSCVSTCPQEKKGVWDNSPLEYSFLPGFFPEKAADNEHLQFTSILLDDHAFHTHADHHYLQLSKLTSSIISVSSPNGQSNLFYELSDTAKKEDLFILHWIHNPLYDRGWYDTLIQTASAGFVEQFVNQQFAFRYRNKHKPTTPQSNSQLPPTPPLTPNPPIAEQYIIVSLSNFFPKESGKKTSTKPANSKTPAQKAAFKHDTPTSATPKPKRPPIISALTGNIRTRVKTMTAITYNTYYDVRNHISKSHKANLSQPFVPYEDYNEKTIVQSWNRLNRLIANRVNMQLISGEKAVSLVNKYSSVPVSQSLIVTSEPDRKLRYEFRVLFFNDGFVKNYYRKLLENRRRIEAAEKKRIEDEILEKEVEEYNRQFREKYDRLSRDKDKQQTSNSGHLENQCHLEPDSQTESSHLEPVNQNEARKYASERSPERKQENPHSPSPDRKHENEHSPFPERKHETPQPQSPPAFPVSRWERQRIEREARREEKLKKIQGEDGRFYPRTTKWKISITPPQTPKKPEPAPSPPEFNPGNPCPPHLKRCIWTQQNPVYCNVYCPLLPQNRKPSPQCHLENQCHLEPASPKDTKEHASERSPYRKGKNEHSPSPDRKHKNKQSPPPLPSDLSAPANCPPEITYCPLGSDHHIPCYPECPHGMIHNYNRYMREEEAKRIQEKEKSKKKGNKNKTKNKKDPKGKNKGRPPPA